MKKKLTSKSAFFNPRVLIGLCIVLAAAFLALLSSGAFSAAAQSIIKGMTKGKTITHSTDPLVPAGFDCSRIYELGIDKQENFRAGAIMIFCGLAEGGSAPPLGPRSTRLMEKLLVPLTYGAADVDVINHPETFPNVTQSETFCAVNPDNPQQIVIAYNDSRGRNVIPPNTIFSGASVSTDGGLTFDRLTCEVLQG